MHPDSAAIVATVRACCGTRFRAQGRLPGVGLDCVGVALLAAAAAGLSVDAAPYSLGGDHEARLDAVVRAIGCTAVTVPESGDLLVLVPGPRRRHLAIVVPGGIVHAHAGLGRVVEGPRDPAWVIAAAWRFPQAAAGRLPQQE